ncbi:hypothetical protein DBR45_02810 [Pseudomonas sp. HMWF031]|nr:hypothetical protein DBR45_02810 [Pseudomonas sp. HMWF031]
MKNYPDTQLDFLNDPVLTAHPPEARAPLVIEMDHRSWMRFLSEEWLFPETSSGVLLGVGLPCETHIPEKFTTVGVWFDQTKLPNSSVMAWRDGAWVSVSLANLHPSDQAILWNGPLPLFAVDHFSVPSSNNRAHLLAQVSNFADIDTPQQPVEVFLGSKISVPIPTRQKFPFGLKKPPANWDALRGAAAMALDCVPAIGPWLQVLCGWFSREQSVVSAQILDAPWLGLALWSREGQSSDQHSPLWRAIIDVFSDSNTRTDWRSDLVLSAVCSRARALGGNGERLTRLQDSTEKLLKDLGGIRDLGIKDDVLELAFQLVLLRHKPERYVHWKKDRPSIPPGAWWTGAILTGYLAGFRALPLQLRGSIEARKSLSLSTWQMMDDNSSSDWSTLNHGPVNWIIEHDSVLLRKGPLTLAEHKFSNRGRWYELDLTKKNCRASAETVALQHCPWLIQQTLLLNEGTYELLGTGTLRVDAPTATLQVDGRVEILLGSIGKLDRSLDVRGFRHWLATSSLELQIPNPTAALIELQTRADSFEYTPAQVPSSRVQVPTTVETPKPRASVRPNSKQLNIPPTAPPKGLIIVPEFITPREETSLLAAIDSAPWDSSMSRKVQHYGWRYDYKARKVDPSAFLGPLPKWAEALGKKLFKEKYLAELPDQVIVNEYLDNQGISKHIDCIPCFRGAVATISLLESWEMLFSRKLKPDIEEKYKVVLQRRSAAILSGESRKIWYHEIPKRWKEAGVPRVRRISITFRKVDV